MSKELIEKLEQAKAEWLEAKSQLRKAEKAWVDAETKLIEKTIAKERIEEQLRVYNNTTPKPKAVSDEIKGFRERNPEVCQLAYERDLKKSEG